ncbi:MULTISPECIES: carboxymuconolactone decarboxylase family protein [Flavobacteriaceae]|uniref:carboxymuconolactone decarboxylase family protein n=1 Tax=Flavobacteriaceae TaxID=49546 RepID=UPI001FED1807|nr:MULTISPECIES: carboxymuconolactone decarboxylase family protein [Allomuricauda]MDC6364526.1 carboxymuconolactone decarboxylase family protein [Muricauda sp. AC10]
MEKKITETKRLLHYTDKSIKEIAVVAALTAMGTATPQLKVHINAALNVGLTPEEISEIMILMSLYAGFPASLNGTFALKEVLEQRGSKK